MSGCCCSPFTPPSSGGASLVNLPNTVWVAQGTTVPVPSQTGNIEAPFATLAAGRAALVALANPDPKLLVVMPGDYSAEPAFAWDATSGIGRLHMVNGSWLPMQLAQSIQNVAVPALSLQGLIELTGIGEMGNITGNAGLYLTSVQKLGGTIACSNIQATNSYLFASMTFADISSHFRDCSTGPISTPGDTPWCITFIDTDIAGNITFTSNPGRALLDAFSLQKMAFNGRVFINGTDNAGALPDSGGSELAWFGGAPGTAVNNFLGALSSVSRASAAQASLSLVWPKVVLGLTATCATSGGAAANLTAELYKNGVATGYTITITAGNNQALVTPAFVSFNSGDLLQVRSTTGVATDLEYRVSVVGI